jgi:ubiquinone biosynthesis monooxygenase Coq7
MVERIVRVDHAGEYGATRIYAGQLAVLGRDSPVAAEIRRMAEQEDRHLKAFEKLIVERRVRPTALAPLWHVVGFTMGAATAMLGEAALQAVVEEFRADELEHRDTALAHGAEGAPGYPVLSAAIKAGSRLAIWLSERI